MSKEPIPILTKDRQLLFFYEEAAEHQIQGQMMFDRVLFVKIVSPGNKDPMIHEVERVYPEGFVSPVFGKVKKNPIAYERFGEYIDQWKKSQAGDASIAGTPIENWPQIDVQRAAQLKYNGVYVVEQLAVMHDEAITRLGMGGRELVKKAQTWIKQREDGALAHRLEAEKLALEDRLKAMQEQMDELADALNSLPQEAKAEVQQTMAKRRGRPPKVQAA